ncbi:MAG: hypothetical protein WA151_07545 [Desulfatirhabdiaceae bacterium]
MESDKHFYCTSCDMFYSAKKNHFAVAVSLYNPFKQQGNSGMPDSISAHEESIETNEELEPPSHSRLSAFTACLFIRYPLICISRFAACRQLSHS